MPPLDYAKLKNWPIPDSTQTYSERDTVLYALGVANESWWSIAHAPTDDAFVGAPPYPRRAANTHEANRARDEAMRYYREVAGNYPGTPEAASALRMPARPPFAKRSHSSSSVLPVFDPTRLNKD